MIEGCSQYICGVHPPSCSRPGATSLHIYNLLQTQRPLSLVNIGHIIVIAFVETILFKCHIQSLLRFETSTTRSWHCPSTDDLIFLHHFSREEITAYLTEFGSNFNSFRYSAIYLLSKNHHELYTRQSTMCNYTQVEFRCSHIRWTVRSWCTRYETTHIRCQPSIVAIEFRWVVKISCQIICWQSWIQLTFFLEIDWMNFVVSVLSILLINTSVSNLLF